LSYQQLDLSSEQQAHALMALGACANTVVAICLPRCPDMIVAILAILKSGSAYLPIDPELPVDRIKDMIEQSGAIAIMTLGTHKKRLASVHKRIVLIDEDSVKQSQEQTLQSVLANPDKNDLAYIIFTSGSTGRPKGVMLNHHALSIRLRWLQDAFKITAQDRVAQTIQYNFDPSLIEIFLALTRGACLVLAPPGFQEPEAMAQFIVEQKINALALVPSSLRNLVQGLEKYANTHLRVACCGGEVLPAKLANEFTRKTGARLLNVYGPTETAILATAYECTGAVTQLPLPIGKPIDDTKIYIVDSQLKLLPIGVTGEIVIGGEAVASGYMSQAELSQERFVPDPYHPAGGGRLYKSGDMGYIGVDGELYFIGRVDSQVKISGYRIELGEIESLLASHPKVRAAAVKVIEINQQKGIYAFVEGLAEESQNAEALTGELSQFLRAKLPDYMQPRAISVMALMPTKATGKIDYDKLLPPERVSTVAKSRLPSSSLEIQLLQLWVDALKTQNIGVEDNFFELGGDSLSAVTLLTKIERLFGARQSLSLLLENPTIQQLALALKQEQVTTSMPLLITLSEDKTAPPFYLAASGYGDRIRFANLAEKLGDQCTLHMLQPPLSEEQSYWSIGAIAKAYADAIMERNEGPCYIGGFSIGGVTALETARILTERGKAIEGLLLLDTLFPRWPLKSATLFWLMHSISKFLQLNNVVVNGRNLGVMFADLGITIQLSAIQHYQVKAFNFPTVLFISEGMKPVGFWIFSRWSDAFSNLICHSVPGSHGGIFQQPHLQQLAKALRSYIKKPT
jgi:syringomycin synthetase protein SyrE